MGGSNAGRPDVPLSKSRLVSGPALDDGSPHRRPPPRGGPRRPQRPRSVVAGYIAALLALVVALALGVFFALTRDSDETEPTTGAATDGDLNDSDLNDSDLGDSETATATSSGDPADADGDTADGESATATDSVSILDAPPPDGAYLDARLDLSAPPGQGLFVLSGRLAEAEESTQLLTVLGIAYNPFAEILVETDPTLEVEPWMGPAAEAIPMLGSLSSGAVRINADGVTVEGSASPGEVEDFRAALDSLVGDLPVDTSAVETVGLREPSYRAVAADGAVTLSGELPTKELADSIVAEAAASYGPTNVVNDFTVTPDVHRAFWMFTVPGGMRLLQSYPAYQFSIADGAVSAELHGDSGFAPGSAELTEQAGVILPLWYAVLIRAPAATLTVIGHTDSDGPEEVNQALSEARAQAFVDALLALGVDPDRVVAAGAGASQPLVPNDSPENKALNRRVEFVFE